MIDCSASSLRALLNYGLFEPAAVQREYQWDIKEADQLWNDLVLFAEARLGVEPLVLASPGPTRQNAQNASTQQTSDRTAAIGPHEDGLDAHDDQVNEPDDDATAQVRAAVAAANDLDVNTLDSAREELDDETTFDDELEEDGLAPAVGGLDAPVDINFVAPTARMNRRLAETYFLGPIVLQERKQTSEPSYFVFDGLQRLTTIVLLLTALRDGWRDRETGADQLVEISNLLRSSEANRARRLTAPTPAQTITNLISDITPRAEAQRIWRNSGRRIVADERLQCNYERFRSRLAHWSDEDRTAFLRILLDDVVLAVTLFDDRSLAYQAFVAANDRGLRLDFGSTLKGKIVEIVYEHRGFNERDKVERIWRSAAREVGTRFSDLLTASEMLLFREEMKSENVARRQGDSEVPPYESGAKLIDMLDAPRDDGGAELAEFLSKWVTHRLAQDARNYTRLYRFSGGDTTLQGVNLSLVRLSWLPWRDWEPVALELLGASWLSKKDRFEAFDKLQLVAYALYLMDHHPSFIRATMLDALEFLAQRIPPHHTSNDRNAPLSVSRGWRSEAHKRLAREFADPHRRRAIVRWLESHCFGRRVPKSFIFDGSVEHILPQRPTQEWRSFNEDDRILWTNRLGNLCIIPTDVNAALSNASWDVKRPRYKKLGSAFPQAQLAARFTEWSADSCAARQKAIEKVGRRALRL